MQNARLPHVFKMAYLGIFQTCRSLFTISNCRKFTTVSQRSLKLLQHKRHRVPDGKRTTEISTVHIFVIRMQKMYNPWCNAMRDTKHMFAGDWCWQ